MARKFFVGGNFKMNGTLKSLVQIVNLLNQSELDPNVEVVIAPPSLYLIPLNDLVKNGVQVAAQNAYVEGSGAFTGEISPTQIKEEGINWVIIGHSERRTIFQETSEIVAQKTDKALKADLGVILCVGESLSEREAGKTAAVVQSQLDPVITHLGKDASRWSQVVIAYEPVWAIGTGKVATVEQAQEAHRDIRAYLTKQVSQEVADAIRIIYGGSVTDANAKDLASPADIDGFLVGGASLKPAFVNIINVKKQ